MRAFRIALAALAGAAVLAQTSNPTGDIMNALRAGQNSVALELTQTALKQSPRDPRLWTLEGVALSHLGNVQNARDSFRRALDVAPDYAPALEGLGQSLYQQHSQDAVAVLERLRKIRPDDETPSAMLAVLAFERRDCKSGIVNFERSRALFSSQRTALEQAGVCLMHADRAKDAVPVFQQVVALSPSDKAARYNLAVAEWQARHYQDVIACLTPLRNDTSRQNADALDLLAEAYEAVADTPKAVDTLRAAIGADPSAPRYYVDFADLCLVHSSFQVGLDMLNFGLQHVSARAPLYLARGILYAQLGQYAKSENDFARTGELDAAITGTSEAEGILALQQNKLAEAETTIRERLRKVPNDAFLNYLLAETLTRSGASMGSAGFAEALSAASRAIELKPRFALARDVLSRLYLQEGKTQEAIEQSRLAVHDDPTDQTALYHLILALRKSGQQQELPSLLGEMAKLKQESQEKEKSQRKYALVEPAPNAPMQ